MLGPPSLRYGSVPVALFLAVSFYALYNHLYTSPPKHAHPPIDNDAQSSHAYNYWPYFFRLLTEASPRCALPHKAIEAPINGFADISPGFAYRPNLIELPAEDLDELREAHSWFVSQIKDSSRPQPLFTPGTSGIVTAAGGEFLPEVVVCLRMLRRTGSVLPVDVYLESPSEYEGYVCESLFPSLDARCLLLTDVLDDAFPHRHNITRYQLKAFALLHSSFDNVLWLDADEIPLLAPETHFETEPFLSRGLVTWPDYWANTASPLFYEIASTEIPEVAERASSESGQLLVSKSQHLATLQLVAYYNYYGPSHYYRLLSQGAVGEGDKETFLAAAESLGAPFYSVAENIETIGWHDESGGFHGTGMVQYDPSDDYRARVLHGPLAGLGPRRAFLHSSRHKLNAGRLPDTWRKEINQRMWGPPEAMVEKFGLDVERVAWDEILYTACDIPYVFQDWKGRADVCEDVRRVYESIFGVK